MFTEHREVARPGYNEVFVVGSIVTNPSFDFLSSAVPTLAACELRTTLLLLGVSVRCEKLLNADENGKLTV
jgi:hypothetical protein